MQYKKADDFVISTNKTYSVRRFIEVAFERVGINLKWKGKGIKEVGYNKKTNKIHVKVDKIYFRPNDVEYLKGDYKKIKKLIGWKPKVTFEQLVNMMVDKDIEAIKKINHF